MQQNHAVNFQFNRSNTMRNKTIIAAILSTIIGVAVPMSVLAEEKIPGTESEKKELVQSGTLEVTAQQVRLIVGGSKGKGVLHFNGKDYKFKMSGKSLGGAGVTKVDAVGTVYNLKDIKDFSGTYAGMGVGAAVVKGQGASSWENSNGVVVKITAKSEGVALNLGLNTVEIELVK
jgi:hypothetical protein